MHKTPIRAAVTLDAEADTTVASNNNFLQGCIINPHCSDSIKLSGFLIVLSLSHSRIPSLSAELLYLQKNANTFM